MFKKFSKPFNLIFTTIFIIFSTFFVTSTVYASQMYSGTDEENTMGIIIEESSESTDGLNVSSAPDLGDDQAFPFIPGFGKNSGKDWNIL